MGDVEIEEAQNNENEEFIEETKLQNEAPKKKKGRKFHAKEFRQQLLSNSSINAIKEFVQLCVHDNSSQDFALEYLESGGGCIELVRVIESSENKSAAYVLPVFEALTVILLKIISSHPQKQLNGEESCRELLNKHFTIIKSMLALSSNTIQRKVALKLLATMVTLSPKLAKEVLAQVFFDESCLKVLTNPSNVVDGSSVRTSFIHFLIAFLIEGDSDIIQLLLQNSFLLQSILPGLIFDTPDIVNLVLSTIQEEILQNSHLTKTIKMTFFNQKIIQNIINLYNWKGPKNYNPSRKKQSIVVDPEDKQLVCEISHQFLIVLCTSRKHGIIFQDESLGLSHAKNNSLLSNVVKSLNKPWNNTFVSDLIVKICAACPDLTKEVMHDIESSLETRASQNWLNVICFIKQIIEKLELDHVKKFLPKLTTKQLFTFVQNYCVPQSVLKIISTEAIVHKHIGIRHESILLLLTMLNSIERYINTINNLSEITSENKKLLIITLTDYLNKNLPSAAVLLKDWRKTKTEVEDSVIPIPEYDSHLTLLLDILYKYKLICPELVDQITKELDVNEFFKTIEDIATGNGSGDKFDIYIKAINLFLTCDSSKFHPSEDLFSYSFPLLLKLFYEKPDNLKNEIESILYNLLSGTGIFEGCDYEIMIFLYSILELDTYDENLGIYLASVFQNTCEKFFKYNTELGSLVNTDNSIGFSIANWLLTSKKTSNRNINFADNRVKHKSLSPLVIGLLDGLTNPEYSDMSQYTNKILVHLLFSQTCPNNLTALLLQDKYKSVCSKNLIKYCKNTNDIPALNNFKKMLKSDSVLSRIFNFILSDETDFNFSDISLRSYYSILLTNFIIYYYTQLVSQEKVENLMQKKCLQVLLYIINNCGDNKSLHSCLNSILRHPVLLKNFSASRNNKQIIKNMCTEFVIQTIEELLKTKTKDELEIYIDAFRVKLAQNICYMLRNENTNLDTNNLMDIVKLFDLTFEQNTVIIKIISELPYTTYNCSIIPELLSYILSQNYVNLNPFDDETIKQIGSNIQKLNSSTEVNLEELENSLCCYIKQFPHINKNFDPALFDTLITKTNINKSTIKLATVLLKYNKELIKQLESHLDNILEKRELVFSLLNSIKDLESADSVLSKVYQKYEPIIIKFINKPQKVPNYLIENYSVIVKLVNSYMSIKTCNTITGKIQKFDVTEQYHSEVLVTIFNKSLISETDDSKKIKLVTNFVTTMIHLLTNALKRAEKSKDDWKKINNISKEFCTYIIKIINVYKIKYTDEAIFKNVTFQNFSKLCLKFGLQESPILIRLLKHICSITEEKNDELGVLFEMAISHSESLNILLSNNELKAPLLSLLLILCKKCPSVMAKSHIPVFLGAYGATLSECDQYLLQLLTFYEQADLGFHEYRPYLWGTAAVGHYSVRTGGTTNLWRQPAPRDVLGILKEDKIKKTVVNFPRRRQLRPTETLYSESELDVYDPAFYLPLLSHVLAPESTIRWYHISNRGIITLVIICLTSESEDIRAAACHVLARFYSHVEASRFAQRQGLLWRHVVEFICQGTSVLPSLCLSSPVAVFLCRCAIIFSKPDDVLYKPLGYYFLAKECPNFNTVPELLEMMFNTSVQYRTHRNFILQVIRDGLKTKNDLELVFRSMAFKLIMDMYNSNLGHFGSKSIILEVISAAVKISLGSQVLLRSYSLLSWLQTILHQIHPYELDLLVPFIDILYNLVIHMSPIRLKYHKFKILLILVSAIDIFKNSQVDLLHVVKFVKILYLTYDDDILNKTQLSDLLRFCSKFVDCNTCNYYLMFGSDFSQQPVLKNDDSESLLLYYLESLTLKWIDANKSL